MCPCSTGGSYGGGPQGYSEPRVGAQNLPVDMHAGVGCNLYYTCQHACMGWHWFGHVGVMAINAACQYMFHVLSSGETHCRTSLSIKLRSFLSHMSDDAVLACMRD
jgi:hypothetical protein